MVFERKSVKKMEAAVLCWCSCPSAPFSCLHALEYSLSLLPSTASCLSDSAPAFCLALPLFLPCRWGHLSIVECASS